MRKVLRISIQLFTIIAFFAIPGQFGLRAAAPDPDGSWFADLEWREIGPYRGGRSAAVAGIRTQPNVYYFGPTGGGVWKTIDGGNSWQNVSDGFFGGSIVTVSLSDSDPNVIYVVVDEKTVREYV
jgi:hypothetical protein